jgi:hypothetical protein
MFRVSLALDARKEPGRLNQIGCDGAYKRDNLDPLVVKA